jgi:hypothetical protein
MGRRKTIKKLPSYYIIKDKPEYLTPAFENELLSLGFVFQGALLPIGEPGVPGGKTKCFFHLFSTDDLVPLIPEGIPDASKAYVSLVGVPICGTGTLHDHLAAAGLGLNNITFCQTKTLEALIVEKDRAVSLFFEESEKLKQTEVEILTRGKNILNAHIIESTRRPSSSSLHEVLSFP